MPTPPIPPKSSLFFRGEDYSGRIVDWFLLHPNARLNMERTEVIKRERLIIASYAEVEWRKRAERWEFLCFKYEMLIPSARYRQFEAAQSQAEQHASAWRAWAEGEKK